ncbi:mucin-associated surface protein (MASP), putative, partial [Trypanosoma cruzi marinkellei]
MAMMMTGRVLLVCALCVLWCGASGGDALDFGEKKALGDCMALGVLDTNYSHMASGCDKTALKRPLRLALPITALQADAAAEGDDSLPGVTSSSGGSSGSVGDSGGGGGGGSGKVTVPEAKGTKGTSRDPPDAERSLPPINDEQNTLETYEENSTPENQTKSIAPEQPLGVVEARRQDQGGETRETQETEVSQGKAASLTSTSGSSGAQSEVAAVNDNPQRSNPEGPRKDRTEAGNTHDPSTASDTAPPPTTTVTAAQTNATLTDNSTDETDLDRREGEEEGTQESQLRKGNETEKPTTATVTAAQTNATRMLGDSDGSTAASHTTSPLLLLACAAA